MAFNKVHYIDGVTRIDAKNLNDIQDAILGTKTANGTVVSQNADFAEVAEWADGNPNKEDRTGYFVCANVPLDGIVMRKATSIDDVKGVSIHSPAFAGNYTEDKLDSEGNLLPKYSFVAILGFVPVIDNGTCTVGGRCMPDDNGCAVPSSNSMGYQVVNRIDENRVLIIIEPNGDMVQRIKTKINRLQEGVASAIKNTLRGEVLTASDVSPIEHNLKVNVESKNLIPFPYNGKTETINGVTFTHNGDGTITVNGTATANAVHYLRWDVANPVVLGRGIYFISGCPEGSDYPTYYVTVSTALNGAFTDVGVYNSGSVNGRSIETDAIRAIGIVVKAGVTANNLLFKPQIEKGTTATPWTPYVADVSGVKVSVYSDGVEVQTATANADGTVEGLTSISPNMTLLTDTSGAVINLEYNADTKMYIDNKIAELSAAILNT